jgi:hypothetical protein
MDFGRGKGGAKKMFPWDKVGPWRRWGWGEDVGWGEDIPTYNNNSMKIVPMLLNLFKEKEMSMFHYMWRTYKLLEMEFTTSQKIIVRTLPQAPCSLMQELCKYDIVLEKTNQEAQQFSQGTNLTFNPIDNVINSINFHNCANQVHHNV